MQLVALDMSTFIDSKAVKMEQAAICVGNDRQAFGYQDIVVAKVDDPRG